MYLFKEYQQQVINNANVLAQTMIDRGFEVVSGGTKNHLMLVLKRPVKNLISYCSVINLTKLIINLV